MTAHRRRHVGTFCLVLHTHLPLLAHHGAWPVGEEWLHQAWAQSYLPVVELLEGLAAEGRRDVLTLGVTPVLAAQLDDPYCLSRHHAWLGSWRLRAEDLAARGDPHLRALASHEFAAASHALDVFEERWRYGGSPVLRRLADAGVVELLGGPATHAFQPVMHERVACFALRTGLDDHVLRFGSRPEGIWAPECGYRPGLEDLYKGAGVQRFVLDGPTLRAAGRGTDAAWTIGGSGVVAFGRDLATTYRIWSPASGYPAGAWYRDFHTYDHASGIKPARVTSTTTPPEAKAPYDPDAARTAAAADVEDFVATIHARLTASGRHRGRPGLVVVAYDTELFGHWWHEGPQFLEALLRRLPETGVRLSTLRGAVEAGHVAGDAQPGEGSWGLGKDFGVWAGDRVHDLVALGDKVQSELLDVVDSTTAQRSSRRAALDDAAREALLALSSDWAFMVSHGSAADYARARAHGHAAAFAAANDAARRDAVPPPSTDRPFGHLDARMLSGG